MPLGLRSMLAFLAVLPLLRYLQLRLRLSRAKHRSLGGHSKISKRLARLLPYFEYQDAEFFRVDEAPEEVERRRREAFERLSRELAERAPQTLACSEALEDGISDVAFVNSYRVPFPFRRKVREELRLGTVLEASEGNRVRDLDGNWSLDLSGSYGVNVFGNEFYKGCIEKAVERVRELGPVLGPYHPVIAENVRLLKQISGMDEVSFHMSGTEAVMQAVALARYHTRRSHAVRFCGAYHGWWDGVQPGVGNPRRVHDVYTLKDRDERTLRVLRTRRDIACVLVNPLQSLHPNRGAPSDGMLLASGRRAHFDREASAEWLRQVREVCTRRGIVLIVDDVFMGFRLARGGSQEYFGIEADLVTYGKTLGGGLPIGVVCGRRELMKRYRDERPSDVCFARGTFNSHPYVMAAMNEVLRHVDRPEVRAQYEQAPERWEGRAAELNRRLHEAGLPVRVAAMLSVWTVLYEAPSAYNWMFQYYLRRHGLALPWIGTGRLIFSHDFSEADCSELFERFVAAARQMQDDGWWWASPKLSDESIKRRVFRRVLRKCLGRER